MEQGWTLLASPAAVTPGQLYLKVLEASFVNAKETYEGTTDISQSTPPPLLPSEILLLVS